MPLALKAKHLLPPASALKTPRRLSLTKRLNVAGQRIVTDGSTVYVATTAASLKANDLLGVQGVRNGSGQLVADRIEAFPTADIEIEAAAGEVALNGRVRTQILRRQAERLARASLNGWQFHNNLIADDRLAMDLAARLAADPRTATANVRFEVFLGVAYLGGTVNSPEQRAVALELASQAPGVIKAEDRLTIAR